MLAAICVQSAGKARGGVMAEEMSAHRRGRRSAADDSRSIFEMLKKRLSQIREAMRYRGA